MTAIRIWRRAGLFLVWFLPSIVIWPFVKPVYVRTALALGQYCLGSTTGTRVIRFEPDAGGPTALDSRILVINRSAEPARAIYLGFDLHGLAWTPAAIMTALILSTPISWRRRAVAFGLGQLLFAIYILVCWKVYITAHLPDVRLSQPLPTTQYILSGMETALIEQIGPGLILAVLIWGTVTLRKYDFFPAAGPASR